jgi:hypothetical protein
MSYLCLCADQIPDFIRGKGIVHHCRATIGTGLQIPSLDIELYEMRRCIDVPPNECRMKPLDREGVESKWWLNDPRFTLTGKRITGACCSPTKLETSTCGGEKHADGKRLSLQKDGKPKRERMSKRGKV